jgi:putative transcriptional regulator
MSVLVVNGLRRPIAYALFSEAFAKQRTTPPRTESRRQSPACRHPSRISSFGVPKYEPRLSLWVIIWLMPPTSITSLRRALGLSQVEFGQLFGVHAMTVSKWERGLLSPTAYQLALMDQFQRTADQKKEQAQEQLKQLLIGAGVVAALVWLLGSGK